MSFLARTWLIFAITVAVTVASEHEQMVRADVKLDKDKLEPIKASPGKSPEDSIPVIEIRGEGKPMSAAQIRALEEEAEGRPLDIKVKKTWVPRDCPRKAARRDFVTFQYKAFLEDGKKIDQSYNRGPVRMQLGVGMTMPGLDKGLKGMCDQELRKIHVPWRLSRKRKSKIWKHIPNEEHWLVFDVEMLSVEAWTPELQFAYMDTNNDTYLTPTEVSKHLEMLRKEFGKHWHNEDIDNVLAAKYFVAYFDADGDGKVSALEYVRRMNEDEERAKGVAKRPEGRKRDPGVAWILDFNNDGVVTMEEMDRAPEVFQKPPPPPPAETKKDEL